MERGVAQSLVSMHQLSESIHAFSIDALYSNKKSLDPNRLQLIVTGIQYCHMAKLFLAVYNPDIPKLGLGYQRLRKSVAEEVFKHAKAVCGIALFAELPTAPLTAIIACGPWFHDRPREEQELLPSVMKRAEVENAWSTASLAQGLMEERDW